MIVAIDGPAGSGKSTIAKMIAEKLGFTFLNSGSFYRGITLYLQELNIPETDKQRIIAAAESIIFDYTHDGCLVVNGRNVDKMLHSDTVDAHVAAISAIVEVRHIVNKKMLAITQNLNIVCEGRDMTTVVFPNAEYKFFLDASVEARAQRRFNQGCSELSLDEIRERIRQRDEIDRNKEEGSLKIAPDAFYFDTSDLTIDQVCGTLISKIQS